MYFYCCNVIIVVCLHTVIGLVVNGMRILDLAAEGDSRITIEGDVDLDTKPLKLFHRLVNEELFMLGFSYK